jgi:uncharacterized protein YhfF
MMRFIFPIACVALAAVLIGLLVEPKAYRAIRHISGLSGPEEMYRDRSSMVSHHTIDLFWQACLLRMDQPPADGFYRVRSIGGTPEITEAITKLILAGDKTGTFTSPWMFEGDREITPVVGGYSILTDSNNAPAAVLKTTLLMTLPFNQITENETAIDGPRVRPIDVWRPIHVTFFTNELEARGKTFVEGMPVTVEQFKVVCTSS